MARRSFEDQEDPHCDKKNRNGPTLRNASTVGDRDRTRRVSFVFADSTNTKSADSMSLSEGLPHLFRKRTLQGRLNLLEGVDRTDRADRTPTRQESFAEGSVLFEDTDSEFADHLSARLLASSYHISRSDDEDTVITNEQFKSSYYPPEPPLPDKVKDMKWFRVFASCIVVSSNGVQYALSQFMPYVSTDLGQKCMASAISLLICFFTLGCIFHGCFLMKYMASPRSAVLATSPLVLALILSASAVQLKLAWLMQVSFALTGFGIGPSFLSAIIHLQFWLPKRPAMASSIGMAFGGFGSVVMSIMIDKCIKEYGISTSFVILAITLFGLQVGGGLFLVMPDLSESHTKDLLLSHRSKLDATVRFTKSKDSETFKSGLGIELRSREIISSWQFVLFWISTFTGLGPGYALFANLAMIFTKNLGMSKGQASLWVVLVNLIATLVGRLPTGHIADRWNASRRKLFGSGCRSMFLLYHCLQTVILLVFAFVESHADDVSFSLFLIILVTCIFGGCNVLIAALSRELFAPINSSIVYGFILTATAASSLTFPNVMPLLYRLTGSDFVYNMGAAALSFAGVSCCMLIQPLPEAYGISNSLLEANI